MEGGSPQRHIFSSFSKSGCVSAGHAGDNNYPTPMTAAWLVESLRRSRRTPLSPLSPGRTCLSWALVPHQLHHRNRWVSSRFYAARGRPPTWTYSGSPMHQNRCIVPPLFEVHTIGTDFEWFRSPFDVIIVLVCTQYFTLRDEAYPFTRLGVSKRSR